MSAFARRTLRWPRVKGCGELGGLAGAGRAWVRDWTREVGFAGGNRNGSAMHPVDPCGGVPGAQVMDTRAAANPALGRLGPPLSICRLELAPNPIPFWDTVPQTDWTSLSTRWNLMFSPFLRWRQYETGEWSIERLDLSGRAIHGIDEDIFEVCSSIFANHRGLLILRITTVKGM